VESGAGIETSFRSVSIRPPRSAKRSFQEKQPCCAGLKMADTHKNESSLSFLFLPSVFSVSLNFSFKELFALT
jgi:hypothetical protein